MKPHELFPDVHWINQSSRDFTFIGNKIPGAIFGRDIALNDATIDITAGVIIKDRVHFGHQVMILTTEHPPEIQDGIERRKTLYCQPIVIEEDAYIGSRAIILKGVTIGRGAYIGAGAVVTKSVPAGEVWAGVPARKIR